MALAGWDAVMQTNGRWSLRDSHESADKENVARFCLLLSRSSGGSAWVHQENAINARGRTAAGAKAKEGVGTMSRKHLGSTVDDFLKEEGIFEISQANAVKEVVAWQLADAMKKKKISKKRMAVLLKTSRTQVDRLLDAKDDITLSSLQRAAGIVGRRVMIELV
jgi:antitoxin HicB